MNRTSVGLIWMVMIGVLVWLALQKSRSKPMVTSNEVWQHRIDSILSQIKGRDTLIISRDSVVYRTTKTRELITEYRTETDTVTKIILCDSIVVACDSLAVQFRRQDSLFREERNDYATVVNNMDSVIVQLSTNLRQLKRRNKILVGLSAVLGVVAIVK